MAAAGGKGDVSEKKHRERQKKKTQMLSVYRGIVLFRIFLSNPTKKIPGGAPRLLSPHINTTYKKEKDLL